MSTLRIPEDNVTLATYGITSSFLVSSEVPSSVLHVNATTRNNGTTVKCVQISGNGLTVVFEVTLAVYGERSSLGEYHSLIQTVNSLYPDVEGIFAVLFFFLLRLARRTASDTCI